jgi:hypothetical protein
MKDAPLAKSIPSGRGSRRAASVFTSSAKRAVGRERDHLVADPRVLHAFADFLDDAGELAPGRERQRRLELVLVLDDQHVGEIHARRLHRDHDFAGPGRGDGTSSTTSDSGGPNCLHSTAFTGFSSSNRV